jgi:hypothetical protein
MFSIQEQEEANFNPQSESVNCFTEAQSLRPEVDIMVDVKALVDAGKVVVVGGYLLHCRATDAVYGAQQTIEKVFDVVDVNAANQFADSRNEDWHDIGLRVVTARDFIPILPRSAHLLPGIDRYRDEIPF